MNNLLMIYYFIYASSFTGLKMFCAGPNISSQPKNLLHLMPLQKAGKKKPIFVWHKKFGQAQNVLGPLKGQGTCPFTGHFGIFFFQKMP